MTDRTTRSKWEERFREESYPADPDPSPVLRRYLSAAPDGRALDVATGTGRNALALAEAGYAVDAVDLARAGLETARGNAVDRGVNDRINWIQGDLSTYGLPDERYALVTVSFFRCLDRFADLTEAIAPGGYLFVEHHLRSTDPTPGGSSDPRYRLAANELLRASLGLTILHYDEGTERPPDGKSRATARVVARKSTGSRQSYPSRRAGFGGEDVDR
ncbi:class I SAM-dependent methyltransferase [Halopenitus persicus]|uniref:Methyltransferase domain-containing protein n=1 Tax=Halopenitus persicus TaxID=1048396 RepID=A0A1H3J3C9_9EURY|nr:class I SAM-dependent methyltransferase [Halopenitus persicus]SDY34520.1 Methyltransferase domain-containing protein [Halopenitus persicus]